MSISLDKSGPKGRKRVDSEVNMVPFIDLLVCCISFLIITAVWSQLERLDLKAAGPPTPGAEVVEEPCVTLQISVAGFTLADDLGLRVAIPKNEAAYDLDRLASALGELKRTRGGAQLRVVPEDGVAYGSIVSAMDVALRERFEDLSVMSPN